MILTRDKATSFKANKWAKRINTTAVLSQIDFVR